MLTQPCFVIECALAMPMHAHLAELLSYVHTQALARGQWVRVPLGRTEVLALVWQSRPVDAGFHGIHRGDDAPLSLKPLSSVLPLPIAPASWCELVAFAARYYQRHLGELAMAASPPMLRTLSPLQLARKTKRLAVATPAFGVDGVAVAVGTQAQVQALSSEQTVALQALSEAAQHDGAQRKPHLLWGATGSGKTEVYLRLIEQVLQADPLAQALVLVPEINLTPQLEARFKGRLEAHFGEAAVLLLHSALTPARRLENWMQTQSPRCRVVLGTRLAIFAPLLHLRLLIVDEEHDTSYKAQDGARYSARDLAIVRAQMDEALVVLGSATPSLQTWHNCEIGKYIRHEMASRIGGAPLAPAQIMDMRKQPKGVVIAPPLLAAIHDCAARGAQSLVFLNRRGYASLAHCASCGWKSHCLHCSACMVFHKRERLLRCHHCSAASSVPRACPQCGNLDIGLQGRGTEQIEELLLEQLQGLRVLRIDADSTRLKGSLQAHLAQVHAAEVDVLVGTQMVTKGHDFRQIGLVIALNPDAALFAHDYKAGEQLFALLMQAAGRAGRNTNIPAQAATSDSSYAAAQFWIQTHEPHHPLYVDLMRLDYARFAKRELAERQMAAMPPFVSHALLRAEARSQPIALAFLEAAAQIAQTQLAEFLSLSDTSKRITLYPAIAATMRRVADLERVQMLVECANRAVLQRFLSMWQPLIKQCDDKGLARWALDVDPTSL